MDVFVFESFLLSIPDAYFYSTIVLLLLVLVYRRETLFRRLFVANNLLLVVISVVVLSCSYYLVLNVDRELNGRAEFDAAMDVYLVEYAFYANLLKLAVVFLFVIPNIRKNLFFALILLIIINPFVNVLGVSFADRFCNISGIMLEPSWASIYAQISFEHLNRFLIINLCWQGSLLFLGYYFNRLPKLHSFETKLDSDPYDNLVD